jgi:hypothetical protein
MTIQKLPGSQIESNTITITQIQTTAVTSIVTQARPRVSSLIYPGNDTAGNTVGGQTVYINGSGFETNNAIYINGNAVPSKTFISTNNLSFTTPALSAGIYPVYVINTDSGSTAIFFPGYISSAEPAWVTSAGSLAAFQDEGSAWSYSLSATGDAPITYALAGGSSLPSGISLAANGVVSGTLSSPPEIETTYTFSVVATDVQNQDSTRQFTVTTIPTEGVLFANNVLLIHADGTNNKNNHTFLDSSNNNFTITRVGNATQGSFSPFSQTGWSGYFDGTGDTLTVSSYTAANVGTGNFTFEMWIYPTSFADYRIILDTRSSATASPLAFGLDITTGYPYYYTGTSYVGNAAPPLNAWSHLAFTRSGTTVNIWLNGVSVLSRTDSSNLTGTSTGTIRIGSTVHNIAHFLGYISNFRAVKGTAVYTSAFTPPTAPLTNIANTSLLTLQSNRFIDNSNNNFAITRNGDTSIQAFAPFAPTAAYSTANVGGSGYFDGSGDYLSSVTGSACNLSANNFTIELWFYPTIVGSQSLVQQGEHSWRINLDGSNRIQYVGSQTELINGSILYTINQWHHIAVVANGATTTLYVNGVSAGTTVSRPANSTLDTAIGINTASVGPVWPFLGYISDVRIVKGTAVYTSAFTPPTAPLTNIANTSLLCNFTNAGIFDQTAKAVLETVGDAKVSTAQYKYGTGSMYFDGTGDYLKVPDNLNLRMESGSFTIEFWWYPVSIASYQTLFDKGYTGAGALLFQTGNGDGRTIIYAGGSSILTSNTAVSTNTWTHIALVRNGSTLTLYQNGNSVGSNTNSTNFSNTSIMGIGGNHSGATFYGMNGYLDDLRVTKGYARYTSNFTAPAYALKDK